MSSYKTNWILDLTDRITKPVKKVMDKVDNATQSVDKMTKQVKFNEKETKDALNKAENYYSDLKSQIDENTKELNQLEKAYKTAVPGRQMAQARKAFEDQKRKVNELERALEGAEKDVKDLTRASKEFGKTKKNWADVAIQVNQTAEIIDRVTNTLSFGENVKRLEADVKRMTGFHDDAVSSIVSKAREIGDVYNEDSMDIARAANAMTKQIGGTYEENLALLESGFKRGANLNGDFLDQMKEYGPQLKALGISGSQSIAMITQAGKDGIYSDKAIDSLKEANLSIREMQQPQIDALQAIGLEVEQLAGKTSIEAIQMISKSMEGATTQAKQMVMADIFKGAGEDSGAAFIEGLAGGIPDIEEMEEVQEAGAGLKSFFSRIRSWAGDAFGSVAIYAQELGPMVQGVAGAIPIVQQLAASQKLQAVASRVATVAQWAWNAALTANPIGLVIVAVGALVAGIVWLTSKVEGWGDFWTHTWEGAKILFDSFVIGIKLGALKLVDFFQSAFDNIIKAYYKFRLAIGKGNSEENQAVIDRVNAEALAREEELKQTQQKFAETTAKGVAEVVKGGNSLGLKSEKDNVLDAVKKEKNVNNLIASDPLSFQKQEQKEGSKKKGDGLEVSGSSSGGGLKSLVMNLTVNNSFSVDSKTNVRDLADKITGMVNDRLRDSLVTAG